eukprot:COSAG02_NODE_21523_length_784_cov_7.132847_1_plen_204_part_10
MHPSDRLESLLFLADYTVNWRCFDSVCGLNSDPAPPGGDRDSKRRGSLIFILFLRKCLSRSPPALEPERPDWASRQMLFKMGIMLFPMPKLTYTKQVVALVHTHFYPALIARHRPPHHRHDKPQLRLACAQAHRGRSARLQALLAWLMLQHGFTTGNEYELIFDNEVPKSRNSTQRPPGIRSVRFSSGGENITISFTVKPSYSF